MKFIEMNFPRALLRIVTVAGKSSWPIKLLAVLLLIVGGVLPVCAAPAESTEITEYQVKAAFLYKFCLYVEWPPNAFASADSPIVLGIAGPASVIELLKSTVKDRKINGRSLEVRHIENETALDGVHVLFVARAEQGRLAQFVAQARGRPLLLVTESPADLDDGGSINFAIQDNRIRFDADLSSAAHQRVRLSAQLLKVARTVRGETGS